MIPVPDRVTILGAGSWGAALSTLLGGCERVTLWGRDAWLVDEINSLHEDRRYLPGITLPDNLIATTDLESALHKAQCVVFAIPSAGMKEVADQAAPYATATTLIINASKGLDDLSGLRMSEVIAASLGACGKGDISSRIAAISGPNLALEVARGVPTATVAASSSASAAESCQALWMGPAFRVYTSDDLVGVELAGATKNVIAIAAGVCEGLDFGDNSRAALMTRGLAEITRLGVALGAQPSTFLGLAGVGDLIATGGSRLSRNYRVGVGLGNGRNLDEILAEIGQVAEGVPTTRAVCLLARRKDVEMPIAEALYSVMFEKMPVREAITSLMLRPPRRESDI